MSKQLKKGFTLIELLIVVLIISIAYGLVVSNMTKPKKPQDNLTLLNLKENLLEIKQKNYAQTLSLECTGEDCSQCKLFIDGEVQEDEISLFTKRPKLFSFDANGYLAEVNNYEGSCFSYEIYPNNTSSKLFLEYNGEYYIFYPFLEDTKKFSLYEEAKKVYDPKAIIPTGKNQYYAF